MSRAIDPTGQATPGADVGAGPPSGTRPERWRRIAEMTCSFAYTLRIEPDGARVVEWMSRGFTELLGWTAAEVNDGAAAELLLEPADVPLVEAWMARVVDGERATLEHRLRTKSGDVRWVRNHACAVRGEDEEVIHVDGAVLDITERVRAEEARRRTAAMLQAIVDNAPLAIIVVDLEGKVTAWNQAAEQLFGWSAEEAVGRRNPVTRPEDAAAFQRVLDDARRGEVVSPAEGLRRRKDGSDILVAGARAVMRDAAGEPTGVVGMLMDITAARAEEDLRRRSEQNFRTLIERSPDAVGVYQGGVVRYANPKLLALLGYGSEAELIGRDPLSIVHPDDRPWVIERMRNYSARGLPNPPAEERFLRKDGTVAPVEVISIPLFFDDAPSTLVHARDLTERKRLEAQLVMADRLASVGRLAATVGHEINNPLAFVLANLELSLERLGAGAVDAERAGEIAEMLREAREGAERVRHIVRDLKVFSRGDTEERAAVDPRRVIDSCANMAKGEIRPRARLVKRYGATPRVLANEARLGQVLLNLLVNAAHAIPEDAPEVHEITVTTSTDERGRVVIDVRDTGSGIPDEVKKHIFEPFFTTKTGGLGTGLGLSICQNIVAALGGEITVESEVGRGTAFRVVLPPAPDSEPPASRLP